MLSDKHRPAKVQCKATETKSAPTGRASSMAQFKASLAGMSYQEQVQAVQPSLPCTCGGSLMKARNSENASSAQSSVDRGRMVQTKNGPSSDSSGDSSTAAGSSSNDSSTGDLAAAVEIDREILCDLNNALEMELSLLEYHEERLANATMDEGTGERIGIATAMDGIDRTREQIDALETVLSTLEQVAADTEHTELHDPIEMHELLLAAVQAQMTRIPQMIIEYTERQTELIEAGDYDEVSRLAGCIESEAQRLQVLQRLEPAIERVLPLIRAEVRRQEQTRD